MPNLKENILKENIINNVYLKINLSQFGSVPQLVAELPRTQ